MHIETTNTEVSQQTSLAGLPSLLSMLSTYPDPANVLSALISGPLAKYLVRGAGLWRVSGAQADLLAIAGHSAEEAEQWRHISLDSEAPVARCIREGQIFTYSPDSFRNTFPTINNVPASSAEVNWYLFGDALRDTEHGVNAAVVPIATRGIVFGCLGFMTTGEFAWPSSDLHALSAYASALALWMSNTSKLNDRGPATFPRLTERQLEILQLVLHGHSNTFIADRLGVSASTVKQEVQRACVALDAPNRLAAAGNAQARGLIDA